MTLRDWPSDPLELLRQPADVAPPEGAQARVAARLAGLAGAAVVVAGSAGGLASVSEAAPSHTAWKVLGERFVRWSLLPLGVGVAVGMGGQALLASQALQPQPALPTAVSPPGAAAGAVPPAASADPAPALQEPSSTPVPSAPALKGTLAEEQGLLDRARKELASGEPARALTFLEQHARRFPRGRLTEEREAMWINVLVLLQRKPEAKARGQAFLGRFPSSLMSSNVRAALRAVDAEN